MSVFFCFQEAFLKGASLLPWYHSVTCFFRFVSTWMYEKRIGRRFDLK